MYQVQDGYSQYKVIDLAARTAAASPLELVLVLFSGLMDELERLAQMKSSGILDDAEFTAAKAKLLA